MKALILFITWIFGLACGLSVASWMMANERIGDAIVMLYTSSIFAVLALIVLVYLVIRHEWKSNHR
ncbi:hypothetical protein [Brucella thiophenivorans]|uniref:Putative membrane protein n=1 Tax=Brucella thiophenivorans TaxID=571255 RepID=A0A256G3V6_9HYPH|nr:hypothetical protein [Brucella thiophenivorans]OYR21670.1 putative membrane protein [Brucella thiophenivorans]